MSAKYPIIAITGSSGAGTTSVSRIFEQIFRREGVQAAFIEGDALKEVRRWFVEQDLIEGVIYLPENLFYNTTAPGIILFLNKAGLTTRS